MAAAAVLAGACSMTAIAEWAADSPQSVRAALGARRESPDHYSPVMCGMDPVLQLEARQTALGRRDLGVFYQNRVYLFATTESKAAFEKQPQKYAAEVLAAEAATGRVIR